MIPIGSPDDDIDPGGYRILRKIGNADHFQFARPHVDEFACMFIVNVVVRTGVGVIKDLGGIDDDLMHQLMFGEEGQGVVAGGRRARRPRSRPGVSASMSPWWNATVISADSLPAGWCWRSFRSMAAMATR